MSAVQNNSWVHPSTSNTLFVFVHGILSNSDACWRNEKSATYWPSLVRFDAQFEEPSIFVAGYAAGLGSGLYDVRAAADEVLAFLRSPTKPPTPLSKKKIIFVCHSQGGIVVRQMLCAYHEEFKDKHIGIVLCGSPSWGSLWATLASPFSLLLRFRQATALTWGGSTLRNLDRDFLTLLEKKRIPHLDGMCLAETRGRFFGIPIPKFVSEPSATRYFTWKPVAKATHGSLVKPDSQYHSSHAFVRDFARSKGFLTRTAFKESLTVLNAAMAVLLERYDRKQAEVDMRRAESVVSVSEAVRASLENVDREDRLVGINLQKLLAARLSASDAWPYHDLSRDDFIVTQASLLKLLDKLP